MTKKATFIGIVEPGANGLRVSIPNAAAEGAKVVPGCVIEVSMRRAEA
jgi:hypothetical protein